MPDRLNIIIVGAGDAGMLLAKDLESENGINFVGFIDDNLKSKVIGSIKDIEAICNIHKINEIVIAIPSADGVLIRNILLNLQNTRIPIKIIPRELQIIRTSRVRYADARNLVTEDFLGRKYDKHNLSGMRKYFKDKKVFVSGGAGSIGSEIVQQLLQLDIECVMVYDNSEYLMFNLHQHLKESNYPMNYQLVIGNILNRQKLQRCYETFKPDVVIHAAAYKHVHLMQENIDEAIMNNLQGTINIVDSAIYCKIPQLTFISTDKAVNPTSVMGATKRLGEWYIQNKYLNIPKLKWDIVRFGNVINSNGSVLPLFERQISVGGEITVTHKNVSRFFMSIKEASRLVIESTADNISNSTHVLNMGELVNIYEIAKCLIRSKNLIPNIDVKINITGLRKGEKMTEELFTDEEAGKLIVNHKGKVFSIKLTDTNNNLDQILLDLTNAAKDGQNTSSKTQLKNIFPSLVT